MSPTPTQTQNGGRSSRALALGLGCGSLGLSVLTLIAGAAMLVDARILWSLGDSLIIGLFFVCGFAAALTALLSLRAGRDLEPRLPIAWRIFQFALWLGWSVIMTLATLFAIFLSTLKY
jgi:hypothetical protein